MHLLLGKKSHRFHYIFKFVYSKKVKDQQLRRNSHQNFLLSFSTISDCYMDKKVPEASGCFAFNLTFLGRVIASRGPFLRSEGSEK